jgi:hypothetical protein
MAFLKRFLHVGEPCLAALETRQRDLEWARAARRDGYCLRFLDPEGAWAVPWLTGLI